MHLHVSYGFRTPDGNHGFGAVTIENVGRPIREPADLDGLKETIIATDPDLAGATIVIIAWQTF